MTKYMYLLRGGELDNLRLSPEKMQEHMEKWKVWMGQLAQKGTLVDGLPLNKEGKKVVGANKLVHDGPFTEGKEIVGGYLIVNANSLDEAVEISKGCPIFENKGQIEVREIMALDM